MGIDERIVRAFLDREVMVAEEIIDRVPVFGKKYNDAVDRVEEIEAVTEAIDEVVKGSE
jgi:hypothetical protein